MTIQFLGLLALAICFCGGVFYLTAKGLDWIEDRRQASIIELPPPIEHRTVTSFREPAAKGLDRPDSIKARRQQLGAVVSIGGRRCDGIFSGSRRDNA